MGTVRADAFGKAVIRLPGKTWFDEQGIEQYPVYEFVVRAPGYKVLT